VSRVRRRESDERSFLSLRIKHSESDLPPIASAPAARDDLYFLRVIYAEERKPRLSECIRLPLEWDSDINFKFIRPLPN
jgi:hypothetical protein